jgi:Methane oxygenase PmoA
MKYFLQHFGLTLITVLSFVISFAQDQQMVKLVKSQKEKKVDVFIGKGLFTSFLYPDSLEKPVLFPLTSANGNNVTRGFPLDPQPNDPIDHPHHIGIWLNFENVNGLDFWNNSYAIPKEKKQLYGWIKTDKIIETSGGKKGILTYHANWTNQQNEVLLEETTTFEFSGTAHRRIIDRVTVLKANTMVLFTDVKDGLLGIRLAHELQIPTKEDQKFTDNKGNITIVKGGTDNIPTGNYLTSEGKQGNDVWSTRARWCKVYGKMGNDSISVTIIDHAANPNFPTFWHARGYGLFAANPLGEKVFTKGAGAKNLQLKKDESVTFRFRIIIDEGDKTTPVDQLNKLADDFSKQ